MNNGKLNSLICNLNAILAMEINRKQSEEMLKLAKYYNKLVNGADYIDNLFIILCSDGNLTIDTSHKYTVNQFIYALGFKDFQFRLFSKSEVNYFINNVSLF